VSWWIYIYNGLNESSFYQVGSCLQDESCYEDCKDDFKDDNLY
jgi:hypothetical protein